MKNNYLIAANWKQNGTKKSLNRLANGIIKNAKNKKIKNNIILLPPSIYIENISTLLKQKKLQNKKISLGAQNISPYMDGAFTGEISANMLKDYNCKYVLIGHSERRHIFLEKNKEIAAKVKLAIDSKLSVIFCVGETITERNKKQTKRIIAQQLKIGLSSAVNLIKKNTARLVVAYEPVWAIGTGKTAKSRDINDVHIFIRKTLSIILGNKSKSIKILYGGSVNEVNASSILKLENVDGSLVGGASLNTKKFIEICSSI